MLTFSRHNAIEEISEAYTLDAGLKPGPYRVRMIVLGDFMSFSTILAYVIEHEGKLVRLYF